MQRLCVITVLAVTLSACVTRPVQQALHGALSVRELVDVPFFAQDDYQCGPAALATVLVHGGVAVTPEQLVSKVYVPDRLGSLQAELLAATRRHDRVPYRLPGTLLSLLEQVDAGRPVLILQNLGFERWPTWHYAVVVGFDADTQRFLLRSGAERRHRISARRFLASWQRAGRWAMVAVPTGAPPRAPPHAAGCRRLRPLNQQAISLPLPRGIGQACSAGPKTR